MRYSPRFIYIKLVKFLWLVFFKLSHQRSPLFILTAFEHRHLSSLSPSPDVVIDVGFNKGQFSSLVLELWKKKSTVLAFDPHPSCAAKSSLYLRNNYSSRFDFFNVALSDSETVSTLFIAKRDDNSSLLRPTPLNNRLFRHTSIVDSIEVPVRTLSSFESIIPNSSSILLKIDVQGSELSVLKGVGDSLFSNIAYVYIELTESSLYESQASLECIDAFLLSKGFVLLSQHNIHRLDSLTLYCDSLYGRA